MKIIVRQFIYILVYLNFSDHLLLALLALKSQFLTIVWNPFTWTVFAVGLLIFYVPPILLLIDFFGDTTVEA